MPRPKYRPRSQRNRRRLGDAKFNDAPNNGPPATTIAVVGAGSDGPAGVNADYTYDANGVWRKASATAYNIFWDGGLWVLARNSDEQIFYTNATAVWPVAANPPKTGWIIGEGEGVNPPPTLVY